MLLSPDYAKLVRNYNLRASLGKLISMQFLKHKCSRVHSLMLTFFPVGDALFDVFLPSDFEEGVKRIPAGLVVEDLNLL